MSRLGLYPLIFLQGEIFLQNSKAEWCLGFLIFSGGIGGHVVNAEELCSSLRRSRVACWGSARLSNVARPGCTLQHWWP